MWWKIRMRDLRRSRSTMTGHNRTDSPAEPTPWRSARRPALPSHAQDYTSSASRTPGQPRTSHRAPSRWFPRCSSPRSPCARPFLREGLRKRVGACQRSITEGARRVQARPWPEVCTCCFRCKSLSRETHAYVLWRKSLQSENDKWWTPAIIAKQAPRGGGSIAHTSHLMIQIR